MGTDPQTISKLIGIRVREVRVSKAMSIKDLAKRTGMHRPIISRVELGTYMPRFDTLLRFAHALGCPLSDLTSVIDDPVELFGPFVEPGGADELPSGNEDGRNLPSQ